MSVITQVPIREWRTKLDTLTLQERDNLTRKLKTIQDDYAKAKQTLSANAKTIYGSGWATNPAYITERNKLVSDMQNQLLAIGYYKVIDTSDIELSQRTALLEMIKTHRSASILTAITAIINYYRELNGKAAITENQVLNFALK